jgi:hypothetical protein
VCTVVVRWSPSEPVRVLALRDELTSRPFDDPGAWWPEQPGVIGGRDRTAGGTWCVTSVDTGVCALVLNRPQKRIADVSAPSRGVLPLLGVRHGAGWVSHLDPSGMASFLLVLATPERLTSWTFDGQRLVEAEHEPGTEMFTSGFEEAGKVDRYLPAFRRSSFPDGWRAAVSAEAPADDPAALVVRHEDRDPAGETVVFATVFGQLIEARPGHLEVQYSRRPQTSEPWREAIYP